MSRQMFPTVEYQTLRDFTGLPIIREACARGHEGVRVTHLPALPIGPELRKTQSDCPAFIKDELSQPLAPIATSARSLMLTLHEISHVIFNNISHALELPWEKYLSEMHEFDSQGNDELRIVHHGQDVLLKWSTLTIVISLSDPQEATISFGKALFVFSEGLTAQPSSSILEARSLPADSENSWIVYYVRPNKDVFYTQTAGALMTPLSVQDYETRKRVSQL
ncbi:hypothetical protein BKA67DRAFT_662850 [Truncatella angustata]|uniref:Uncharacterized protein n=1 Tax=Truncatella angustata TaxID=152316 RepID=A0A9P8ZSP7_9PEZI|nr:uncharacterized protein BKA67DRAFT_662850 [Truncatella angustata]KAH6648121.1 hypothetical protein BKA67DRAFT_662850 [Truncatella angustata]